MEYCDGYQAIHKVRSGEKTFEVYVFFITTLVFLLSFNTCRFKIMQ